MKPINRNIGILMIAILYLSACKKDQQNPITDPISQTSETVELSIQEASIWLQKQPKGTLDTAITNALVWNRAKSLKHQNGNRVIVPMKGRPTFQHVKQGYRQLSIQRDSSKNISARVLEIIPDAVYHQKKGKLEPTDFTGRIFQYDLLYRLTGGTIYSQGRQLGEARPAIPQEKLAIQNKTLIPILIGDQTYRPSSERQAEWTISGGCTWITSTYVDAQGVFTVYAESFCSFYIDGYHNTQAELKSVIFDGGGGGGGGYTGNEPSYEPTLPSNLPMEDQPSKDPKKLMDCFGATQSPNAAYQVKILVQQPMPGTSFNIGQNAFGHVALQMSKTEGGQTITQTLGFYPRGTGLDKLSGPSRMVDNGGLEYNVSASYFIEAKNFQHMIDYVRNPPANYHYTDFNCTNFVYQATQKGNINLPNPTTQIGLGGPGGVATAMTPAGMASALKDYKTNHPNADVSSATARAVASKGECN